MKRSENTADLAIRRNIKRVVGRNIRRRRLQQGLSESDLGRHLVCGDGEIHALEAGEYSLRAEILFDLAKFLKCRLSDLFLAESDEERPVEASMPSHASDAYHAVIHDEADYALPPATVH